VKEAGRRATPPSWRFVLPVSALALVVAAAAAIPPGVIAAGAAARGAAESFRSRAEQLARALAAFSVTQVALRSEGYATIRDVTAARHSMPEAVSVTISGPHQDEIYNSQRCSVRDYVLASDEAAWEDARAEGRFSPASRSTGDEAARKGIIADFQREVEARLTAVLDGRVREFMVRRTALRAMDSGPRKGSSGERLDAHGALSALGREIDEALSAELTALGSVRSYPGFDPKALADRYVFYAPIAFFDPSVPYFCNGMVRLTVETSSLRLAMQGARRQAATTAAGFGLLAFGLGVGVAVGFAASGAVTPRAPAPRGRGTSSARREKGGKAGR
jgi:hypothetical protein